MSIEDSAEQSESEEYLKKFSTKVQIFKESKWFDSKSLQAEDVVSEVDTRKSVTTSVLQLQKEPGSDADEARTATNELSCPGEGAGKTATKKLELDPPSFVSSKPEPHPASTSHQVSTPHQLKNGTPPSP